MRASRVGVFAAFISLVGCATSDGGNVCTAVCAAGQTRCVDGGVEVCVVNGVCADWGQAMPCVGGEICQAGQCRAGCATECAAGSLRCIGNAVQACEAGPSAGCFVWGESTACVDGESCSGGECASTCRNECAAGVADCDGSGVRICGEFDEDPCLDWGATTPCSVGETCSGGECSAECADECAIDSRACAGAGYTLCDNYDDDPCLEWSDVIPCGDEETCSDGQCARGCDDECAAGARRCAAETAGVVVCGEFDDDGCLDWGDVVPCGEGETCSLGECAAECRDECESGSVRCADDGVERCGQFDGDPCAEWSLPSPCGEGQTCSAGQCVDACAHDCIGESRRCAEGGVQTCGNFDDDPCADWSESAPCGDDLVCDAGGCHAQCGDECAAGSVRCGPGGLLTCGEYDADACTEWSEGVPCPDGQSCSDGECRVQCVDECAEAARRCDGNSVRSCGNVDDDACLEWGLISPCPNGSTCVLGTCLEVCADECAVGALRCRGDGVQRCGDFDADDCREWSDVTPCDEGRICAVGQCAADCTAECGEGAVRCSAEGVQTCGDFDICPRWGAALGDDFVPGASRPCPDDTSCSSGECLAQCRDECDAEATRCAPGGALQRCGHFDPDPCREWSDAVPCDEGESCSDGQCRAICVDECENGAIECAPGEIHALRTCGNFDPDACTEWGPATPCAEGLVCGDGQCAACVPDPGGEIDDGHDNNCNGVIDERASGTRPGWCNLQWPPEVRTTEGFATVVAYGQVWFEGLTEADGPHPGVLAEIGFGPDGSEPAGAPDAWTWSAAAYNVGVANNDEYLGRLIHNEVGTYDFAFRFSVDGGDTWGYCDLDGSNEGSEYDPARAGTFVVGPGAAWSNLQFPHVLEIVRGEATPLIYGQVFQPGVTDREGRGPGLLAQLGYALTGVDPRLHPTFEPEGWTWVDGVYNVDVGANDEYAAQLVDIEQPGVYDYAWRYSLDDGVTWVYGDIDGGPNGYSSLTAGRLTVLAVAPALEINWAGNWGVHFSDVADCAADRSDITEPVTVDEARRDRAACRQIVAEVYVPGHTDTDGRNPDRVLAEIERWPLGGDIADALHQPMTFYRRVGNNHEYRWDMPQAELDEPPALTWQFFVRFSGDGGQTWHRIGLEAGLDAMTPRTLVYDF